LHVVACDVLTGGEVLLSRGSLVEAILASAAIPGVLPPVEWNDRLLIDGGVVNNTPISHAVALGADHVYVLQTGGPCALTAPPRGALAMLVHATELMVAQRFTGELASLRGNVEIVVLPPPCPIDVQPIDFGHADALMTRAEVDARAFLARRDAGVVPTHGRHRRRTRPGVRADLTSAS
jgi:NTE family protein